MDATEIRRLTELAARAAGIPITRTPAWAHYSEPEDDWNPAHDDGDSFGLMCDLGIDVVFGLTRPCVKAVALGAPRIEEDCTPETRREAARLAVLRAAAALGELTEGGS